MTGTISATVREIIDRVYPVHIILDFAAEVDPNVSIGCGTEWTRIEDGRALIASSAAHAVGSTCGAETATLTEDELPKVTGQLQFRQGASEASVNIVDVYPDGTGRSGCFSLDRNSGSKWANGLMYGENTAADNTNAVITLAFGGGQPHSSMQPSLAVCRWTRTA